MFDIDHNYSVQENASVKGLTSITIVVSKKMPMLKILLPLGIQPARWLNGNTDQHILTFFHASPRSDNVLPKFD